MQPDKMSALSSLVPDGNFELKDDETVVSYRGAIPSDEKIQAEMTRLQAEYDALQYQRDRVYPSIGEQLDLQYWDKVNGTSKWQESISKVKSDHPKPTE
jgi:hypothetical protein